jgi:hypothetical protein
MNVIPTIILILYDINSRSVTFLKFIYAYVQISKLLLLFPSSLILPFRYSLSFFLNVLLVSLLKFCTLSPLIWVRYCNHCNLACFPWLNNFVHSSSNRGLLCFSLQYHILLLAEVLILSLILPEELLTSKLSSMLSKTANLFQISTWYFLLISMLSGFCHSQFL